MFHKTTTRREERKYMATFSFVATIQASLIGQSRDTAIAVNRYFAVSI